MKEVRTVPEIPSGNGLCNDHPMFDVYGRGEDNRIAGKLFYQNASNGLPEGYTFEVYDAENYSLSAETMRQIAAKIDTANEAVRLGLI